MPVACQGAALGVTPSPWETLARCELNSGALVPRALQVPKRNTKGFCFRLQAFRNRQWSDRSGECVLTNVLFTDESTQANLIGMCHRAMLRWRF